jgi:hypothetical protein
MGGGASGEPLKARVAFFWAAPASEVPVSGLPQKLSWESVQNEEESIRGLWNRGSRFAEGKCRDLGPEAFDSRWQRSKDRGNGTHPLWGKQSREIP